MSTQPAVTPRRLASMVVAIGLLGSACSLTPPAETEAGAPSISSTHTTIASGSVPEQPTDTIDPAVAGAAATTELAATEPATDPITPPVDDEAGSEDDTGSDTDDEAGAETETPETDTGTGDQDGTNDDRATDPSGPFTLPARAIDDVLVADGGFQAEAHSLEEPVNLVFQGGAAHVVDLLVQIGDVPAGSTLVVDYGDGSIDDVGVVSTGQHVTVRHTFEPTLTFDNQNVVATLTQPDGTEHRDRLTFGTRARFALSYSPISVRALNDCDTFGKGDFRLTWDHGEGEREATFKLGAGESARIGGFAGPGGLVVYDEQVPFELELVEEDPWGATLFAPWKWDAPEFRGASPASNFRPVKQVGDHAFTVTSTSSTHEGISGDDDCATFVSFDVTLDMLDD